ncbi:phytoene/squalene synthase family protein [Aureimonas leprariae]|uniref:Phytoene/squalene synthase family protein n=1 Tax=Plantimonas leprariae TaxID=2615207 RepID=A0A7V7PSL8_9HYPH|nr:phytoene/squalene synthase family protein [Aureimonas leprariae]KAB0682570.1 phytoene/squalene synthase family protein [Aureimonas leprariae]
MNDAAADRAAIVRAAAETIAKGSNSFAAAARLFDAETRADAIMLYAWCRHCDDVVDGQTLGHGATGASGVPERLAELERETRRAFAGERVGQPAFRALQLVAERRGIPLALALDHLDGFRMDVDGRVYESVPELLDYCYHVAGVVGAMMALIMGTHDPDVLRRACDLGLAFQLTNIARDIVPDAEVGRIYLPRQWLREVGLTPETLADPAARGKLAVLAKRLVDLAEPYYASARIGVDALPRRSSWAIATALGVYREIGLKVVARGAAAWDERVSTSGAEKLRNVAGAGLVALKPRRAASPPRPAALWTHPAA